MNELAASSNIWCLSFIRRLRFPKQQNGVGPVNAKVHNLGHLEHSFQVFGGKNSSRVLRFAHCGFSYKPESVSVEKCQNSLLQSVSGAPWVDLCPRYVCLLNASRRDADLFVSGNISIGYPRSPCVKFVFT